MTDARRNHQKLEITNRDILEDMQGRLKVLESTAEKQAAALMQQASAQQQQVANLAELLKINRWLLGETRRLLRVKEVLLEAIGRDVMTQRAIDSMEIPWSAGESRTTNQLTVREKTDG